MKREERQRPTRIEKKNKIKNGELLKGGNRCQFFEIIKETTTNASFFTQLQTVIHYSMNESNVAVK